MPKTKSRDLHWYVQTFNAATNQAIEGFLGGDEAETAVYRNVTVHLSDNSTDEVNLWSVGRNQKGRTLIQHLNGLKGTNRYKFRIFCQDGMGPIRESFIDRNKKKAQSPRTRRSRQTSAR